MRHAWARTGTPRTRSCGNCGATEKQRLGPTGAWRTEYSRKRGGRWSKKQPACVATPGEAPVPKQEPVCGVVVHERPYLLCAEDVARLLALPGREAVLAEVEAGRLERPVAGERWPPSDCMTYASTLQALRDQGEPDAARR